MKKEKVNQPQFKEDESFDEIDAGIGIIGWRSNSLALQMLMDELADKLKKVGYIKVRDAIGCL